MLRQPKVRTHLLSNPLRKARDTSWEEKTTATSVRSTVMVKTDVGSCIQNFPESRGAVRVGRLVMGRTDAGNGILR